MKNNTITSRPAALFQAFLQEIGMVLHDKGAILILFIAMLAYPVVYSIAYMNNVITDIPVTIVDMDRSSASRQLIRMVNATSQIEVAQVTEGMSQAEELFWAGSSKGVILIPSSFERDILRGDQVHLGVYCDAGYFLIYKETLTGAVQSSGTFSAGIEIKRLMASGATPEMAFAMRDPVATKIYPLYNPSGAYGSYVMPGLILIILQQTLLIGIGMIGGAKRERGVSSVVVAGKFDGSNRFVLSSLAGKALAYFALSIPNLIFTQILVFYWFGFPDKGSLFDIWVLTIPFLFSVIFMGLAIALVLTRREHAIMLLVFLSPVVLFLSGMSWPENSLPPVLYKLAHLFPSTSMVPAYLRIRTMGGNLADVRPELLFLTVQMVVYAVLSWLSYRLYLKRNPEN